MCQLQLNSLEQRRESGYLMGKIVFIKGSPAIQEVKWNAAESSGGYLNFSNVDRTVTSIAGAKGNPAIIRSVRSTVGHATGKRYAEVTLAAFVDNAVVGLSLASFSLITTVGDDANSYGFYRETGVQSRGYNNSSFIANIFPAYGAGNRLNICYDNGKMFVGINGVYGGSPDLQDPVAGTNPIFSGLVGTYFITMSEPNSLAGSDEQTINGGDSAFVDGPPHASFLAWNIPD